MARKKVCVSFDFEHDKQYYYLMKAWNSNPDFEFTFNDMTTKEIRSESVSTVKNVLIRKIGEANYMVAIIGSHSHELHPDRKEIGYSNWQAYEIAVNHRKGNGLVCVYLDLHSKLPSDVKNLSAEFVYSFNEKGIIAALNKLCSNRWC